MSSPPPPYRQPLQERTAELAEAWRARGGISAAMRAIRKGPPARALDPALALLYLAEQEEDAPKELDRKGSVRALLQVFDCPGLTPKEVTVLLVTMHRVLTASPSGPAQLVAAFADDDPKVAFGAAVLSSFHFSNPVMCEKLVGAGVGPALLALLSHRSSICRSAAAIAVAAAAQLDRNMHHYLRQNGVLPALTGLLQRARLSQDLGPGIFSNCFAPVRDMDGELVPSPLWDPALASITALIEFAKADPVAALTFAALAEADPAILRPLRKESGESPLLGLLMGPTSTTPFGNPIGSGGFSRVISDMIDVRDERRAAEGIEALHTVWIDIRSTGLSRPVARIVIDALERYIEAGGASLGKAALVLIKVAKGPAAADWRAIIRSAPLGRSETLVGNLARFMAEREDLETLGLLEASSASMVIMEHLKWGDKEVLLSIAMREGFVRGIFRMIQPTRSRRAPQVVTGEVRLWAALEEVMQSGQKRFVMEAVECGLLPELKDAASTNTCESLLFVLRAVVVLAGYPEMVPQMREAGVWPSVLVKLAKSLEIDVLKEFLKSLREMALRTPHLVTEVLAAGALRKVKSTLDRMVGPDPHMIRHAYRQFEATWESIPAARKTADTQPSSSRPSTAAATEGGSRLPGTPSRTSSALELPGGQAPLSNPSEAVEKQELGGSHASKGGKGSEIAGTRNSSEVAGKQAQPTKSDPACANCGKCNKDGDGVKLKLCSGCNIVFYCGRDCQVLHWPSHKATCKAKRG
eukprot:jgi/Botrbrau1/14847/Bobra.0326s0001.1